jgi:hypothetical protein
MEFAMKIYILAIMLSMLFSCSNADKFSDEKSQHIRIEKISGMNIDGDIYLFWNLQTELESCINLSKRDAQNLPKGLWKINGNYYHSIDLDSCYLTDYISSFKNPYNAGFGEHLVELILIDIYGDSIGYSTYIRINEPLKITLLSPIDDFSTTEPVTFQYKISGVDSWEQVQSFVYSSTDKESLWEEENAGKVLNPPFFWGVMAFTDHGDSAFSEVRTLWPKD